MLRLSSSIAIFIIVAFSSGCTNNKDLQYTSNEDNYIKSDYKLINFETKVIAMLQRINTIQNKKIQLNIEKKKLDTDSKKVQESKRDIIDISLEKYMKEVSYE